MNVLVVGAGATGGYFGARLAQAGTDVSFLLRSKRATDVRERGLRIVGQGPDETVPVHVVTAEEITNPYDLVLLAVKNTGLSEALEDLTPAVGPKTLMVPFQNGIAHLEELNKRFGPQAVLGGVVKIATTLDAQGQIVRLTPWASLAIGAQHGGSQALETVVRTLEVGTYDFSVSNDIIAEMWNKWVMIASVGALTCLLRGTVGEIVAVPHGHEIAVAIADEVAATATACGFPVAENDHDGLVALLTQQGSPFASSMYRDLNTSASVEVESILGDLERRAQEHDVDTPLLRLATTQLRIYQHRLDSVA